MADLIDCCEDGVATVTLNRPSSLNALSDEMIAGLLSAFDRLSRDPKVRAIVLTGAGRAFCAGGDIKAMAEGDTRTAQQKLDWTLHAHKVPMAIAACPKVTIACINGAAMGAGLGMALACDFRIAARSARFGISFVKIALATDFGVSWFLPRIVGEPCARELILTGDIFGAEQAFSMGLLTRMVEDSELASETRTWAQRFARGPQRAYATVKRNLQAAPRSALPDLLDYEAVQQIHLTQTEDHQEAVGAFLAKRPAIFGTA